MITDIKTEHYMVESDGTIWVKATESGPYTTVDHPTPFNVLSWDFHSRHGSQAEALAIARSLEYDINNPS